MPVSGAPQLHDDLTTKVALKVASKERVEERAEGGIHILCEP